MEGACVARMMLRSKTTQFAVSSKSLLPKRNNRNSARNIATFNNNAKLLLQKTWYQQIINPKFTNQRNFKRGFSSVTDINDEEIQNVLRSMQIEDTFAPPQQKPASDLNSLLKEQVQRMKNQGLKPPSTMADAKRSKRSIANSKMEEEFLQTVKLLREREPTVDFDPEYFDTYSLFMDWKTFGGKYPLLFWDSAIVKESVDELHIQMKKSGDASRMSIWDLKYLPLYPLKVRQWVADAKTPKGYYNMFGIWEDTGLPILPLKKEQLTDELKYNPDQSDLPEDLRGQYRFGVKPEEIEPYPDKLKEFLSFRYATPHEVLKFRIRRSVENYQYHWRDTGSSGIQVAIMTHRIRALSEHISLHPKDKQTAYGLNKLVGKRFRMMKYLRFKDTAKYFQVLKGSGVRDIPVVKRYC